MCNGVRVKMDNIKTRWEQVSKDFTQLLATNIEGEVRNNTLEAQTHYIKAYMGAIKRAGEATAELFNTMEKERLDREAMNTGGATGGGGARGGAPPRVDESLRPYFKGSYALSLNKFNRWQEMANAWGLALMHKQRPPLVQKMYFKQITEKEFSENCNLGGTCVTFQHYVEESKTVYNKRVSIFLRQNEYMEVNRVEDEGYISYYHRLRKLSEMADIKTMREKDWNMHFVMTSLPTNVFKQITTTTINPVLEDVLGTLEVVEQQMRQLNNTKFPLPAGEGSKEEENTLCKCSSGRDKGERQRRRWGQSRTGWAR